MKKLITLLLLISTTLVFAQRNEFTEVYNYSKVIGTQQDWKQVRTTITFNYRGQSEKVILVLGDLYLSLYQIGETISGKTQGGHAYQAVKLLDDEGSIYIIQYFEDQESFGVRLFLEDDVKIQLGK